MAEQIPDRMQAVVVHAPRDYRLEEVDVPVPGPDELLLRVDAVGVCASDLKCFHGAVKFWGDDTRPAFVQSGRVAGHEIAGTVVAGDDPTAHGVALGDRVVVEQIVPCGRCRYCTRGEYWMCAVHDMFGFHGFDGAMAQYLLVPRRARVHRVSPDVEAHHAAYAEPLSCALHAVERAGIRFGDVVVVAGCGPIGLGLVTGARQKNPMTLVALDQVPDKLETARRCGADVVVDISREDPVEVIEGLTDGYGCDVYLEGTGAVPAVGQGLRLLRKLGTYVEYSVFGSDVTVDWSIISDDKELNVLGAHLGPYCWPAAVKLIEDGKVPVRDICTHQLPLAEFEKAFSLVEDSSGDSVKVSLLPFA